jgi:hypothetical protein
MEPEAEPIGAANRILNQSQCVRFTTVMDRKNGSNAADGAPPVSKSDATACRIGVQGLVSVNQIQRDTKS